MTRRIEPALVQRREGLTRTGVVASAGPCSVSRTGEYAPDLRPHGSDQIVRCETGTTMQQKGRRSTRSTALLNFR